jgi:hypothetical protein
MLNEKVFFNYPINITNVFAEDGIESIFIAFIQADASGNFFRIQQDKILIYGKINP